MLLAYLEFGQWGGPYQTSMADAVKTTESPRNPYAMGYGRKIPTQYMILFWGKWRRVYNCCFSNSGTLWVYVNGEEIVVDIERTEP